MGRVLYVMGASGVGKDSLIAALRPLQPDWPVAHRYITRASGASENCVTLSDAEYAWRRDAGLFCLHWQAHGLSYALGCELESWLARADLPVIAERGLAMTALKHSIPGDMALIDRAMLDGFSAGAGDVRR